MINYNRLGLEIKRDFVNFSEKICKGLTRPKYKSVTQMIYSILAGNKIHLSEIARSLNETIIYLMRWRIEEYFKFKKQKSNHNSLHWINALE